MNEPVNSNQQTLEDVARQLERDFEIADNAYLLLLKNYKIDDTTGEIDSEKTIIKEMLRIEPPQVAMIADSDGRIGYDDKRNKIEQNDIPDIITSFRKFGEVYPILSIISSISLIFLLFSSKISILSHSDHHRILFLNIDIQP